MKIDQRREAGVCQEDLQSNCDATPGGGGMLLFCLTPNFAAELPVKAGGWDMR